MAATTPFPDHAYAALGSSRVLRVGYGAMQLEHVDGHDATAVLRRAVELGVDHIDTAEFYGAGVVNRAIRRALHPYPDGLRLVSKIGAAHADGALVAAQRPEQLRAAVEANLATLGAGQLPVVNLRRVDVPPGIVATGDQVVDLDAQLAELVTLRDEGKIGAIGLSQVSVAQLQQAAPVGIVCVQNRYNVLARENEATLAECERLGVAWVPYCPLGSAFEHMAKVTDDQVVVDQARRLDITPSQAAIAWLLDHSTRTLVIAGTRSVDHLEENVAAAHLTLDDEARGAFDRLAGPSA